ncbi:hypothetical protein K461DRAFT_318119 [Myriangium duriaei CBS 260.36]|uniref:RNase III domain-containing protein n=1 Tax=Myriangium duriaei CBS 260.36 TaxID=1168546 RepID=A0A9P4JAN7_9PEZI|nr:hypothetical protein K461DRAFT_318119 [Myriangium duriaei CBS 260.36]
MKRHSEDGDRDPKRQKFEKKGKKQSTQDGDRDSDRDSTSTSKDRETSIKTRTQTGTEKSNPVDSFTLLEDILSSFATAPETLTSALGSTALSPMRSLLSLLRARKQSTSLDTSFPPTFTPPIPSSSTYPLPFTSSPIPSTPFTLPLLPPILPGPYTDAPFIHRSVAPTDRVSGTSLAPGIQDPGKELNYERLEFLGDAYLSLIASSLIFSRFPSLHPGQQSSLRSALVSNDTLQRFSRAYGFDTKLQATGLGLGGRGLEAATRNGSKLRGNKGINKIYADVFEAYVAAAILSDPEGGYAKVERWLKELWTPILLESQERGFKNWQAVLGRVGGLEFAPAHPENADGDGVEVLGAEERTRQELPDDEATLPPPPPPQQQQQGGDDYDPLAKMTLQKRIAPNHVRLVYKEIDPPAPASSVSSTQPRAAFYIAVHLTGWGYQYHYLGKGEGANKVEAGNRAAMDAMTGSGRGVVEICEKKFQEQKDKKKEEKDEKFKVKIEKKYTSGQGGNGGG